MRGSKIAIAVLLVATLGGCGDGSVARDTYRGLPPGADERQVQDRLLSGEPLLTWLRDGDGFAITTWGSSSCPPTAVAVESTRDSITVQFEDAGNEVCTADMSPTTHEFDVPDEASTDPAVSARFRFGATEQTYNLTAP